MLLGEGDALPQEEGERLLRALRVDLPWLVCVASAALRARGDPRKLLLRDQPGSLRVAGRALGERGN